LTASVPRDIALRLTAAIVGVFFVRDGIYALRGKEMWVAIPRGPLLGVSCPVKTRVFGLLFILMA
jgi:hypothetical protein